MQQSVEVAQADCSFQLYVPNAFSPNADGINDFFLPFGKNPTLDRLRIFDRSGGMVFDSGQHFRSWDGKVRGKPAHPRTYVWMLDFTSLEDGSHQLESGGLMLMR